eukprot:g40615.t1
MLLPEQSASGTFWAIPLLLRLPHLLLLLLVPPLEHLLLLSPLHDWGFFINTLTSPSGVATFCFVFCFFDLRREGTGGLSCLLFFFFFADAPGVSSSSPGWASVRVSFALYKPICPAFSTILVKLL